MSNSYNSSSVSVNPLLSTFPVDEINIQPYWIVVLELIVLQLFQRIWHHFKYNTWFTTLEIAGLIRIFKKHPTVMNITDQFTAVVSNSTDTTDSTSKDDADITADKNRLTKLRSMIDIDYFDAVNCLLLFGHAIWYCVIQSTCMASPSSAAIPWNCYNVFGYRLFNYIFVSYCTTALNIVYKTYMQGYMEVIKTDAKRGSFSWLIHYATLIIIMVTLVFVTCLILPFFLTHVLPMFVIYIWMSIIYVVICIYLITSGFIAYDDIEELPEKIHPKELRKNKSSHQIACFSFMFRPTELRQVAISIFLALLITTFPILLSIFLNYKQNLYNCEIQLK
jgi:hypothetical protein